MDKLNPTAISLFTSGGIGDLAMREAGFELLVSNELLEDRHQVFAANFPDTHAITGDLWEKFEEVAAATLDRLDGKELTLLYATPPCQGMSKNGRGKLLNAIRAGDKPPLDERNRLIIPTMKLAQRLRPKILILENVPEMADTLILNEDGEAVQILDFVHDQLGPDYVGRAETVNFADYGVPQCRRRLITVFSRDPGMAEWFTEIGSFLPLATHSPQGRDQTRPWVTVRKAISHLPPLDAGDPEQAASDIPYHRVPLLDEMKYWWVQHTPPECGAFNNPCVRCGSQDNSGHTASRDKEGINRTSRATPIYCEQCGELLPRPSVERNGTRALMRGFTSAYKRMAYDKPASALTRNLSYACSDNKLHPEQNRVLSLHEAFIIHTLDRYDYVWNRLDGKRVRDKTIREVIGESIPPAGLQVIVDHILEILAGTACQPSPAGPLFS